MIGGAVPARRPLCLDACDATAEKAASADVVEPVDTRDLKSLGLARAGSIPAVRTIAPFVIMIRWPAEKGTLAALA